MYPSSRPTMTVSFVGPHRIRVNRTSPSILRVGSADCSDKSSESWKESEAFCCILLSMVANIVSPLKTMPRTGALWVNVKRSFPVTSHNLALLSPEAVASLVESETSRLTTPLCPSYVPRRLPSSEYQTLTVPSRAQVKIKSPSRLYLTAVKGRCPRRMTGRIMNQWLSLFFLL
eukprot:30499_5